MPLGSFKKFFNSWWGILILILIILGLGFLSSSLFVKEEEKAKTEDSSTLDSQDTTADDATKTKTPDNTTETSQSKTLTSDWLTFKNEGFGFTFKYPKDWTLVDTTNTTDTNNPILSQKTVKLKSSAGDVYQLDNPITGMSFENTILGNKKEIKSGDIAFERLYGKNSIDSRELYTATHQDPRNVDDLSVIFFGYSTTLNTSQLEILDGLISTFAFN